MSLSDSERMRLAQAISDAGVTIPLNGCRELDVDGVCDVIRKLAASRDAFRSQYYVTDASHERVDWLRSCAEKDVGREKERLADMTRWRDNASTRLEMVTKERNEAREALLSIAHCGNQKCCKQCRSVATRYASPPIGTTGEGK